MHKRVIGIAALTIVLGSLVPASAQASKPEIVNVRATAVGEGIRFTVKIKENQGEMSPRRVTVTYRGETKRATRPAPGLPSYFETDAFDAPVRDCYRVEVTATNPSGTTTKTMRASRISTEGCD